MTRLSLFCKQIGLVAVPELARDDVAALDQPDAAWPSSRPRARSTSSTQGPAALTSARARARCFAALARSVTRPDLAVAPRRAISAVRGQHPRAARVGVERVEDDQSRIVDPAVRIFESADEILAQRRALGRRV